MGATKTRSVGRIPSIEMVRSRIPDLVPVPGCVLLRLLDVMVD
jgi:hypothetical protein